MTTLLQSDQGFQRAARATATALTGGGRDVDVDVLKHAFIAASDRVWQAKTPVQKWQGRRDESERKQLWDAALTAVGGRERIDPCDAATLFRDNLRQSYALYPDARPTLEALAGRFKLAIITNGGSAVAAPEDRGDGVNCRRVDADPCVR